MYIVTCAECSQKHDIDDCTPVERGDSHIYICLRCRAQYECRWCDRFEYTPYMKATGWCKQCAARFVSGVPDCEVRDVDD